MSVYNCINDRTRACEIVRDHVRPYKTIYTTAHEVITERLLMGCKESNQTNIFAQMYQFSLDLNSLQQKFNLPSNYLGTNIVVKEGRLYMYTRPHRVVGSEFNCRSGIVSLTPGPVL